MKLENYLVLNRYFLSLFGFKKFSELQEKLRDIEESFDTRSHFVDVLIGLKPDWGDLLLGYDSAIREYVNRLKRNRRQPNFNLKYFQYMAILFTEIFLDKYEHGLLDELNEFLREFNSENKTKIPPFKEEDIKKLAFWMATGSGKTLIMHINYWQILKYSRNDWDNIILITPNEGLSKQHYEELILSGIPCKLYNGNIDDLKTKEQEILIIDIHKLTEEKRGEGVSVDISYFDGKNLVFIDEGHKGQKSEEQKWKKLREEIGKNGFLFEYSATFGQVIGKNRELLEEYAKAIIFDYSYKYFYTDGYGKDFYIYNIKENSFSESQRDLLLTAGLLAFYEQLEIFETYREDLKDYNIEKPLWIFVGSTVIKRRNRFSIEEKKTASDVERVIKFLSRILESEDFLKNNIEKILKGKSGLVDSEGNDIFKGKFEYIRKFEVDSLVENIYQKIFLGKGRLELYEIKNAEGELGLKTSTGSSYFGVVNVGDVRALKKLIPESQVKEDHFSESLFMEINKSNINILIGSKKFIEGWNSWRVSCMGLINIGKNEGPQIIQLFGRGVRLKGKDYSLKREEHPDYRVKVLQTLFIFGLNADYINTFLKTIESEDLAYEEITIPIKFNRPEKWSGKIYKLKTSFEFLEYPVRLRVDEDLLKNVKVDLRPRITLTHGLKLGTAELINDETVLIPEEYLELIDWNYIISEIMGYKIEKGMYNLILDVDVLVKILKSRAYKIFISDSPEMSVEIKMGKHVLKIHSFEGLMKLQDVILILLKDYISRFYRREEKRIAMDYLKVETLTLGDPDMFPGGLTLKIPMKLKKEIMDVMKQLKEYDPYNGRLPVEWKNWDSYIVHFDNHLYTPLIVWKKNKEEIKSVPVKLNRGETRFLKDFRNFLESESFDNILLLRNLSRKGIGFFLRSGFYPDFIIWIDEGEIQRMIFIDPKGIRNLGNFNDDKIQLCSFIENIGEKIKSEHGSLKLNAFILSTSPYSEIKNTFGEGHHSIEEFEKHNIFFQEDPAYIYKMLKKSSE